MILRHKLPTGRIIYLDSFHLQATEFDPQSGEASIENALQRLLPDVEDTTVIGRTTPQPYMCLGTFHSDPINEDYDATCSVASLAWFVSDPTIPITKMVETGLNGIDWDLHSINSYV